MRKLRTIYDLDHYKMQLLIQSPDFVNKINKFKTISKKIGCPIPKKGFAKYKDYLNWSEKYFQKRKKIEQSKKLTNEIKKITNNGKTIGEEEYKMIQSLRNKYLPPFIEEYISDILKNNGITRNFQNYDRYKLFLITHIFLGESEFSNSALTIRQIRNTATDKMDLFIQILPYTKRKDIINAWSWIKLYQKYLPGYKERIKEYKNFQRNLEIYNIYKKIQKNRSGNEKCLIGSADNRIDKKTYSEIYKKYGDISWENIRKIVSEMERLIKNVKNKESP